MSSPDATDAAAPSHELARARVLADVFRPSAPIDRRDRLAGRDVELAELLEVIHDPGRHAVVFGERGVGKTSLIAVLTQMLREGGVLSARTICDHTDDFTTIWRKALADHVAPQLRRLGLGGSITDALHASEELAARPALTIGDVVGVAQQLTVVAPVVVFVDEFDRLNDVDARDLFAETIKALSDHVLSVTLVLVSATDDADEFLARHASIERGLAQIRLRRMSRSELGEMVALGFHAAGMTIADDATRAIATLSLGVPYYTHLLARHAGRAALRAGRARVELSDVTVGIGDTVDGAPRSVDAAFRRATAAEAEEDHLVLLAAACSTHDTAGWFGVSDVVAAVVRVTGHAVPTEIVSRDLAALTTDSTGPVLEGRKTAHGPRYRFMNPLLEPYVLLWEITDGRLATASALVAIA